MPQATHAQDLGAQLPAVFEAMQRDYAAYALTNGVLAMPAGYDPTWQVTINSMHNYWIPAYRKHALAALVVIVVAVVSWRWRRRRTRRR